MAVEGLFKCIEVRILPGHASVGGHVHHQNCLNIEQQGLDLTHKCGVGIYTRYEVIPK